MKHQTPPRKRRNRDQVNVQIVGSSNQTVLEEFHALLKRHCIAANDLFAQYKKTYPLPALEPTKRSKKTFPNVPSWLIGKARDVSIRQSNVCDGKGLFAKRLLVPGTTFEYGGRLLTEKGLKRRTNSDYIIFWKCKNKFVDGNPQVYAAPNVNEAVSEEQLNVYLWENDSGVWLTVFKAVEPGTEVLTWYGEGYVRDYHCVKGHSKATNTQIDEVQQIFETDDTVAQKLLALEYDIGARNCGKAAALTPIECGSLKDIKKLAPTDQRDIVGHARTGCYLKMYHENHKNNWKQHLKANGIGYQWTLEHERLYDLVKRYPKLMNQRRFTVRELIAADFTLAIGKNAFFKKK